MTDGTSRRRIAPYAALAVVALVLLAGLGLLIWWLPTRMYAYVDDEKERAAAEASTRTGMIAGRCLYI